MSNYNLCELEEIIAADGEKLEELHDTIMKTFTETASGDAMAVGRYEISCVVTEGLQERVNYLRVELEETNTTMVADYKADLEEAIESYPEEGDALDGEGQSVSKDLFADIFRRVQGSCLGNGL